MNQKRFILGIGNLQLSQIRPHGLDKVNTVDPASALVLVAEIYRCKNLRKYRNLDFVTGTYPKDERAHKLLAELGFFDLLGMDDYISTEEEENFHGPVYWKFETYSNVDAEFIDSFVGLVEKYVVPMDGRARAHLIGAIKEAMQNTLDHAYSAKNIYQTMANRWFLGMSLNPFENEVRIILFDQGVGIPATLPTSTLESIVAAVSSILPGVKASGDGEIIRLATHKYRTRTQQKGRGRGFHDMKHFVDQCSDGELRIRSNLGFYTYMGKQESFGNDLSSLGGTAVEFRFKSSQLVKMSDE